MALLPSVIDAYVISKAAALTAVGVPESDGRIILLDAKVTNTSAGRSDVRARYKSDFLYRNRCYE